MHFCFELETIITLGIVSRKAWELPPEILEKQSGWLNESNICIQNAAKCYFFCVSEFSRWYLFSYYFCYTLPVITCYNFDLRRRRRPRNWIATAIRMQKLRGRFWLLFSGCCRCRRRGVSQHLFCGGAAVAGFASRPRFYDQHQRHHY